MTAGRASRRLAAAGLAVLALATACSSGTRSPPTGGAFTTGAAAASSTTVGPVAAAQASVNKAEQGTYANVDATPRAAVKGKHIVIISAGQSSISTREPADAALAAANVIGWQADLYDAHLNTANFSPLIRQAVAAHADGIILDAIDCDQAPEALQEAKAANIAVIPMDALDCTDKEAGNEPTGLFSGAIGYGPHGPDIDALTKSYGSDEADYIIGASHNTARVIAIETPGFAALGYTLEGFTSTIAASAGSKVVDVMQVSLQDLTSGHLAEMIAAELFRHPDATWLKSPYSAVTTLGIAPALRGRVGPISVMGGEGSQPELDLLRRGIITAVNVLSAEWTGWAAVDTINSVFRHEKPVDSGIGWQIADRAHLPASGALTPTVDFKGEYRKAWGVGG